MGNFMSLINLNQEIQEQPEIMDEYYFENIKKEEKKKKTEKKNNIINILKKLKIIINEINNYIKKNKMENFSFQDLTVKEIFAIFFLWMTFLLNLCIFFNKVFFELFFPNINLIMLSLLIFLCFCLIVIETWNIMKRVKYTFHNVIHILYFFMLFLIVFKSLLYNKGFSWQFYLIIIVINLNLIIFPRFNIIDERNFITSYLGDDKKNN